MRILLVAYHYPPDTAVGALRAAKVTRAMMGAGHRVTVVAATRGERRTEGARGDAGEVVHRVPALGLRDIYRVIKRSVASSLSTRNENVRTPARESAPRAEAVPTSRDATVSWMKRWIFSLIWLPDDQQGFALSATRRAWQLRESRFDLVYSSAPPFSTHLAGLWTKVLLGTPWVAEFRDPWTRNPWKPAFVRSWLSDRADSFLERLCVEQAERIVAVTEGIAASVQSPRRLPPLVVRNGIERIVQQQEQTRPSGRLRLLYVGSFYHTRDPNPLFEAIAELCAQDAAGECDIRLDLLGTGTRYAGRSFEGKLTELGLKDRIAVLPRLPHEECIRRIEGADALVLLATDQPLQVPNKLYEYLGSRRPILAIADRGGETWRMLEAVGGHVLVPANERAQVVRGLETLRHSLSDADRAGNAGVGDLDLLQAWRSERQMKGLIAELEALHVN